MSRCDGRPSSPRCRATSVPGRAPTWWRGLTLLVIAVPEQLATSRLAGMPPITGFYAFVAGTVLFALLGSNPQMSVGADSTIAPLFAAGVSALALTGSPHYVDLVGILAVMVGLMVMLVAILRLGWIAEFLSTPIVTGFLSGVAVIIIAHQLPEFFGLPPTTGTNQHRVVYVLTHLNEVNGWSLAIGVGVLAIMIVSARVDRRIPAALIGLVGSTALVGALDLQAHGVAVLGPVKTGAPHFGLTGLSWSTLREPGTAGRRGGAGRRDPDRRHDPRLRRAGRLRRRRRAATSSGSARAAWWPGLVGCLPGQRQPAPHRGGRHGGRPDPGRRPRRRRGGRRPHPVRRACSRTCPWPRWPPSSSSSRCGSSTCDDLVAIYRFNRFEFALAAVTLLTVVLVGVEQGIGVAVGLAILDRIRLSARPQLHVLGRIPGTTSWQRRTLDPSAEEVPGVLVALFATPIWYANALRFRDEVFDALRHAPGSGAGVRPRHRRHVGHRLHRDACPEPGPRPSSSTTASPSGSRGPGCTCARACAVPGSRRASGRTTSSRPWTRRSPR